MSKKQREIEDYLQLDPVIPITLGYGDKKKDYKLELNNFAVKGILKETGYNLLSDGFTHETMQDPSVLGSMLYWCLMTHHPELEGKQEDLDKLYTFKQAPYIIAKLARCLNYFGPDRTEETVVKTEGEDSLTDPK